MKIKTDFIAIAAKVKETYGDDGKLVMVEICKALKEEFSRLSPEDIEPYLKSAEINVTDLAIEIKLVFPI